MCSNGPDLIHFRPGDLTLEIPGLKLKLPIVGVSYKDYGWDISWLASQAGWLENTAYPGLSGNSVLTSHVTSFYGSPGPFANLHRLAVGELIYIHNHATLSIYQVQAVRVPLPSDLTVFQQEDESWLTLVTCSD